MYLAISHLKIRSSTLLFTYVLFFFYCSFCDLYAPGISYDFNLSSQSVIGCDSSPFIFFPLCVVTCRLFPMVVIIPIPLYNITTCPVASCKWIWQIKTATGQAEQEPNLPAQKVMFLAGSSRCNSPLFNRVAWQVEVLAGQVNFRGSLPCLASDVLEPMLHPVYRCFLYFTSL